jgi:hypothetical protein
MKTIITCLLLIFSCCVTAQTTVSQEQDIVRLRAQLNTIGTNVQSAGKELIMFNRLHYAGVTVQFVGLALIGIAALSNTTPAPGTKANPSSTTLFFVGGGCFLVGGAITLFSHKHVGAAGRIMKMQY